LKLALALPASVKTGSENVEAKYKKKKNSLVVIMQRVNPLAVESPEPLSLHSSSTCTMLAVPEPGTSRPLVGPHFQPLACKHN